MAETGEIFRAGIERPTAARRAAAWEYEEQVHQRVLLQISEATGWEPEEIDVLYKRIMHEYMAKAQVRDYLFVLVSKRVKRIIGTRRHH